jgi:photosystem II stability/assembly factor-like uncharacterized protein
VKRFSLQTGLWAAVALVLAAALAQAAPSDELPLADLPVTPATPRAPSVRIDDDRAWEDISYGTGEANFTAVAVDPENARRLFAGAMGSVFLSEDGGASWQRVLDVRGGLASSQSVARSNSAAETESELDDRIQELREEALEEAKREIVDELIAEFGDSGEKLAEELAEELAEQRISEEEDRLREEAMADLQRRSRDREQSSQTPERPRSEPRRIHRLLALPQGRLFVATGSGLFLSTDRGRTFEMLTVGPGPDDLDVRAVAVHPRRPSVIFAGTVGGLFTSRDGGSSWVGLGDLPPRTRVNDIAIDPSAPDRALIASDFGVYRTTDGGESFVPVLQPSSPLGLLVRAVAFHPVDPRITFAGTAEGIYRALDAGFAWERLEPTGLLNRDVSDLGSAPWGLLAATANGVYLSEDWGVSFRELFAGLDARDVRRVAVGAAPLEGWVATVRGLFVYRPPVERQRRIAAMAEIEAIKRREPPLSAVAKEALAFAMMEGNGPDWQRRASLAPLAPRLTARYAALNPFGDVYVARTLFPVPSASNPNPAPVLLDTSFQTDAVQVLFLWDLQRLLFNPVSVDAARTTRLMTVMRDRILKRVVTAYDARRRLQIALIQSPPADLRALAVKMIQLEELTGVLDGLTNGSFSAAVAAGERSAAAGAARKR